MKVLVCAAVPAASVQFVSAEDWPVYMKDGFRSGVTADGIPSGSGPVWVFDPGATPSPGFYPKATEKPEPKSYSKKPLRPDSNSKPSGRIS